MEHPAEETPSLLLHFHFCQEDLGSIVTRVLRDFRRLPAAPTRPPPPPEDAARGSRGPNPRGAIPQIKRGVNRNAKSGFHIRSSSPQKISTPDENSLSLSVVSDLPIIKFNKTTQMFSFSKCITRSEPSIPHRLIVTSDSEWMN